MKTKHDTSFSRPQPDRIRSLLPELEAILADVESSDLREGVVISATMLKLHELGVGIEPQTMPEAYRPDSKKALVGDLRRVIGQMTEGLSYGEDTEG